MARTTTKPAANDAARKMILRAWSRNDRFPSSTVASDEKSMPRDFVGGNSVTAMGGRPCAAQMLAVEFWIAQLRLICVRRSLPYRAWNVVAVGAGGRPGLTLGARMERAAIEGAMADCDKHDRKCRVIAIGPFLVERLPTANTGVP